jgi:DNA helicase II / ATP-dependent DNA helicase PcrA
MKGQRKCSFLRHCLTPSFSKRIVARLLTPYKEVLQAKKIDLDQGAVSSRISKAKAKGYSPEDIMPKRIMETETTNGSTIIVASQQEEIDTIVSKIYTEYENHLRRNNCLDFDDLLVFGVRLFTSNPRAAQWCRHVLVDEL